MNRLLFFLILLNALLVKSGFGQDFSPQWGPNYKKPGTNSSFFEFVQADEYGYHVVAYTTKGNELLSFNNDHKLLREKKLKFTHDEVYIDRIVKTQSGTYALLHLIDKKAKEWVVFKSKFDGSQFEEPQEIYAHKVDKRRTNTYPDYMPGLRRIFSPDRESDYFLGVSQDSSKIVFANMLSDSDEGNEALAIAVFDDDFNLVWEKVQDFKTKDTALSLRQVQVNNDGKVIVLARNTKWNKAFQSDDRVKSLYQVFQIDKYNFEDQSILLGKEYVSNEIQIFVDPLDQNRIIVTGFYTDFDRRVGLKGLFIGSGDIKRGISNYRFHEMSDEFLEGLTSRARIKKDKGLDATFEIENPFVFSDGTFGFVAEEIDWFRDFNNFNTFNTFNTVNTTSQIIYNSGGIIIPRFDRDGNLLNMTKLVKYFSTTSPQLISYAFGRYEDNLALVFNDFKNTNSTRRFTDMVVVKKSGEIIYDETIFDNRELGVDFYPDIALGENGNFLIGAMRLKRYAVGLVKLDQ